MKQKIFKLFLLLLFSGAIIFSCQKDMEQLLVGDNQPEIEQAKMWYNTNVGEKLELKSGNEPKGKIQAKPVWEKSYVSNHKNYKSVQIPLSTLGLFGMVPEDCYEIYTQTGDKLYMQSLTTMIILTEKKTEKTYGFLMTVVPDKEYRDKHTEKPFHSRYGKRPNDYNGHILYHNLDGSFNNGWKFENGEAVEVTKQNNGEDLGLHLKSNPCTDYYWVEYYIYCTDWWVQTETGTSYMGTTCDWDVIEEWTYLYSDCLEIDEHIDETDFDDEPGGYIPEDPDPQNTPLSIGLNTLFISGTTLENDDIIKLNAAYEQMRAECIFEYIDNYLLNNNVELNSILIDPTMLGVASVTFTGNLKFNSSWAIQAEYMEHEWFHLFQKYYGNINVFDSQQTGMAEFENALLKDIMYFVKIGGDWENTAYSWACASSSDIGPENEYIVWLNDITSYGMTYPEDINASEFQYFSEIFGDVSLSYNTDRGYIYGITTYDTNIISEILNYAKNNCN